MKCINCQSTNEIEADGIYTGYVKCGDCNFLKLKKVIVRPNVIMPDDPMDAMACDGCS